MSNMLHCCHCGRFSLMLSRHDSVTKLRYDYSYCQQCRTLDLVGNEIPCGSSRLEYMFTDEYAYMEERYYWHFLYGKGA